MGWWGRCERSRGGSAGAREGGSAGAREGERRRKGKESEGAREGERGRKGEGERGRIGRASALISSCISS